MDRPDRNIQSNLLRSRIMILDLQRRAAARPLLPDDLGPGTILLGFSPSGAHLAVARLADGMFRLGIVAMRDGETTWLPYAPSVDGFHAIHRWLSDDRLLFIAEKDAGVPWRLAKDLAPDRLAREKWDATARGALGLTVAGSGRYLSTSPASRQRLLLFDLSSRTARTLATGGFSQLMLSPTHDKVAVIGPGRPQQPSAKSAVREDEDYFARTLNLVDLTSGDQWTPCPGCAVRGDPRWADDGRSLAFLAEDGNDLRVVVIDSQAYGLKSIADQTRASAGSVCPLSPHEATPAAARASLVPGDEGTRYLAPIACLLESEATPLAWQPVPWRPTLSGIALQFAHRWRISLPDFSVASISGIDAMRLGPRRPVMLLRVRAISGETALYSLGPGGVRPIIVLNRHMDGIDPARMRPIRHAGPDGSSLTSWLLLPPGKMDRSHLPLVVIPYPGQIFSTVPPIDQLVSGERFYANAQLLAARGFAVLLPSLPMPDQLPTQGYAFADALKPAISAALATGRCDATRIGLWGHSYGAYAVAMASAQSDQFRAVVASAGVYDLAGTVGTFGPGARVKPDHGIFVAASYAWAEGGQGRMGGPPWAQAGRYVANSPVYLADHIHAPMLIIGADRDYSPVGQAEELFSALFRQGKDAQLLTYWGEGHVIASPANVRDLYERVVDFLDVHLR